MLRKPLPTLLFALMGTLVVVPANAADPQRPSPAIQEDPLLKTVEPGAAPAPKRERPSATRDKQLAPDVPGSNVQQDLLLQSTQPGARPPAKPGKPVEKAEKKAEPEPGKPVPKKDSKVQEDLILKSVEPK